MSQKTDWVFLGVFVLAFSAGTVLRAADSAASSQMTAAEREQRMIVNRVDHSRQEVERKGDELVRDANLKLAAGDYMKARDLYRAAKVVRRIGR